jgi:hypothetical protein
MDYESRLLFNGTYEYKMSLSKGSHIYYFVATDGNYLVFTDNFTTPNIENEGSKEKSSAGTIKSAAAISSLIIVMIVILIILFTFFKKGIWKKQEPLKEEPVVTQVTPMAAPPAVIPSVIPTSTGEQANHLNETSDNYEDR